jgi:kynureninase
MPEFSSLEYARMQDAGDELASFRERFLIAEPDLVYVDGNSLGRLPKAALELSRELVEQQWGSRLIRGWNEGWLDLSTRIGGKIARLIGAGTDEVLLADSTSVNLFKLSVAAMRARPGRSRIVTDALNFPSDLYVLRAAADLCGGELCVVPSEDGITVPLQALRFVMGDDVALVSLSHTTYKSAFVHDMRAVTAAAHAAGALMLWDLSHSVGSVPVDLERAGADLAVGCAYKYLNGGPGAPAFLYVRRSLQEALQNPISGWLGRDDPFSFSPDYEAASGLRRFISGTPPVLSLAMIEPGVDLVLEAGLDRIRAKSIQQTEYLISRWEQELRPLGYTLASPRDSAQRGSHVALAHAEGQRLNDALIERWNVIPDFRPPNVIRVGVSPLYTTYTELHGAVQALKSLASGLG